MHDDRRSTIAACKLAPLFPGGGRQTAPDRTRSRSSSPPNRWWFRESAFDLLGKW